MADNMMGLLVVGGLAIGAFFLLKGGIGGAPAVQPVGAPVPVTQQTGNFPEHDIVTRTPGIGAIVITPDILISVRQDVLEPIVLCDIDRIRFDDDDDGRDADSCIKFWEQEHLHKFHTIRERNAHTRMRCRILSFYRSIDWRFDFDDPIRQHICLNKRVIIEELRGGRRDSPRCNSAAFDVADVTAPVIQNCVKCTVNVTNVTNAPTVTSIENSPGATVVNKGIAPGANTPPIPHSVPGHLGGASTTPTTPHVDITNAITAGGKNPTATATTAYGRWF